MFTIMNPAKRSECQQRTRGFSRLGWVFALAAAHGVLGMQPTVQAAVFSIPCGNVAALIAAINTANANGQNDTINLPACTYVLTKVQDNTDGPSGLPSITSQITIKGAGATRTIIERSLGALPFRLVHVAPSGKLTLQGVTLTLGLLTSGTGGGLLNTGNLALIRSAVRDNVICDLEFDCIPIGTGSGGGITNAGTMTLLESTVSNNFASFGGGINNSGTMTLTRSTVTDNGADDESGAGSCGGINTGGTATFTNSTISGNSSSVLGGGICNSGVATLRFSTVVENFVFDGGGAGIVNDGTLSLRGSIVAGNASCSEGAPLGFCPSSSDCDSDLTSLGRNLVGPSCPSVGAGDIVVPLEQVFTSVLSPLQDKGGQTLTHVPLPGSLAIDAGPPTCLTPDQRGVLRPQDGNGDGTARCDIGAVEFDPAAWNHYPFAAQNGTFSVTFNAMPHQNRMNGVTGLAQGPVNSVNDLAVIVRFNSAGRIDARNGNSYSADRAIPYTAGISNRVRLVVNVAQHTYSVFVKPDGSSDQTLARNYAFRTEQNAVPSLDTWVLKTFQGSHTVTKLTLGRLSTLSWQTFVFPGFAGLPLAVNAAFAAIPHQNRMNGLTGLALGPVNSADDLAVIVRFNPAGRIDARNGNNYAADRAIPYTAGVRYEFRLVVNIAEHTYSVFVKPEAGIEQTLATDYAFRTEQQAVERLSHWALTALQGSHTAEGFSVNVVPE
jgi:hypothetical protein